MSVRVPGDQAGKRGMELCRMAAQFQHVAKHRDAAAVA